MKTQKLGEEFLPCYRKCVTIFLILQGKKTQSGGLLLSLGPDSTVVGLGQCLLSLFSCVRGEERSLGRY